MMIQVNLVIPVIKFFYQRMILLILIGSSVKKCACTRSGHSVSDTASHLTWDHDAHHHSSLNLKYVTNSASQDSNDQGSYHGSSNEIESQEDCMEIGEEKASESGNPQFRGQF
jgi:hypothetical protein